MKKVLSFVLVLALVLGSFSMAFAVNAPADVVGQDCESAVDALIDLGVINGYNDGTFKPGNNVTRAEAAKMVVTALGLGELAASGNSNFADCKGHWAEGYIGYAEALGVLKGVGNGMYNPDGQVTYEQVLTMLVRAIGWTDEALPGTWPANYVARARGLGLTYGVDKVGANAANRGDVAMMLFNSLEQRLGYIDVDKVFQPYTTGETMLSRLRGAANTAWTVDGGEFTFDGSNVAEGVNLNEFIGASVIAYRNVDGEITGFKEIKSQFLTGKFKLGSGSNAEFVVGDDVYKIDKDEPGLAILVNGRFDQADTAAGTPAAITNRFLTSTGGVAVVATKMGVALGATERNWAGTVTIAAKVNGLKINDIYSVDWSTGTHFVWTESDSARVEKAHRIGNFTLPEDKNKNIDTTGFVLKGADSLADIKVGDIVSVYSNGDITKIEVSNTVVEGIVSRFKDDTNVADREYTINGKVYNRVANANNAEGLGDVELNAEGKFFLTYGGKIAEFEGVPDNSVYAIVAQQGGTDSVVGAYGATVGYKVKLFTSAGETKTYTVQKSAVITGAGLTGGTVTKAAVASPGCIQQLTTNSVISFTVNKDGEITGITVPSQTAFNAAAGSKAVLSAKGYLNGIEVASNVVVFTGTAQADNLAVSSLSNVSVATDMNNPNSKYVLSSDNKKVVAIVNNENSSNVYGVVQDYRQKKNADDNKVYELTVLVDGAVKTYDTTTSFDVSKAKVSRTTLVAVKFSGTDVSDLLVTAGAMNTTGMPDYATVAFVNIKNGVLKTGSNSDVRELANDVAVYQITKNANGSEKDVVVSSIAEISIDDEVWMYDCNKDEGHEGYDVVIFKAAN